MTRAVLRPLTGLMSLALLGAAPLAAQAGKSATPTAAAGSRIAWVDSRLIMRQAPGYTAAESTFTKELEGYRAEVAQLQSTFDSLAADFEQSSVMLSPTQRTAKRQELSQKQSALEQRTQELQQKAADREQELLNPIQQKVNAIIEQLRTEGSYAMVFDVGAPGNTIVAADKSLDLTPQVIKRLQAGK